MGEGCIAILCCCAEGWS